MTRSVDRGMDTSVCRPRCPCSLCRTSLRPLAFDWSLYNIRLVPDWSRLRPEAEAGARLRPEAEAGPAYYQFPIN